MSITYFDFLFILGGAFVTLIYSFIAIGYGFIIALILTFMSTSNNPLISFVARGYVSVFRGTPLLIQLSLIYYGLPTVSPIKFSVTTASIIAFSMNSGAYISQIIKSGINAVDKGQLEAAKALGVSRIHIILDIILPQVIRNIVPSLINELVNLIKETAVISILGEEDIMRRANMVAMQHYDYFTPLLMAALCYYVIVSFLNTIVKMLEKKLSY